MMELTYTNMPEPTSGKENEKTPFEQNQSSFQMSGLAAYVEEQRQLAIYSKRNVAIKAMEILELYDRIYDSAKLSALTKAKDVTYFFPILNDKCEKYWQLAASTYFMKGNKIFKVDCNEDMQLAPEVMIQLEQLAEKVISEHITQEFQKQMIDIQAQEMQGRQTQDPNELIMQQIQQYSTIMPQYLNKLKKDTVKKELEKLQDLLEDDLEEGNFNDAFSNVIKDYVRYPAAVIKGPVDRYKAIPIRQRNPRTGKYEFVRQDKVIGEYEWVNFFDIFAGPGSSGPQDSFLVQRHRYRAEDLFALKGLDGYDQNALERVIINCENGHILFWDYTEFLRDHIEKQDSNMPAYRAKWIDVAEFWGAVAGKYLKEWTKQPLNDHDYYEACVITCNGEVLYAMLNPDFLDRRPYDVRSFIQIPGAFYGYGMAAQIVDLQKSINAVYRALVKNMAIASGPMVAVNADAMGANVDANIRPWKTYYYRETGKQSTRKDIEFYQAQMYLESLTGFMNRLLDLAGELTFSGIISGQSSKGAERTGTQYVGATQRSLDSVSSTFYWLDRMIEECVKAAYHRRCYYQPETIQFSGVDIEAKGSYYISKQSQQINSLLQFLQTTNNPTDISIIGVSQRKQWLTEAAKLLDFDVSMIADMDMEDVFLEQLLQQKLGINAQQGANQANLPGSGISPQGGSQPAFQSMSMAGQPAGGTQNRTVGQGEQYASA